MSAENNQRKIDAAIELGFLNKSKLEVISSAQKKSNKNAIQVAVQEGYLDKKQLQVLDVFATPLDVVPGYQISGLIGQGGVGVVFKATQINMDRPVAIKVISQAASRNELTPKRFEREAQIIGKLRHPNIISAIDFGIHREQLYLVMEFVEGIDAEQFLGKQKTIPECHCWIMARQVCHALDNASQMGIIHRDIKPANLILTQSPSGSQFPRQVPFVKIADFGLAKFKQNQTDAAITVEHFVTGTPYYMSPEQVMANELDHRTDIYSLGMTIWHMITGSPPVVGAGPLDVIAKKMKLEDEWLSDGEGKISKPGLELLAKMCRHDSQERIGDYSQLDALIETVIGSFEGSPLETIDLGEPFSAVPMIKTIQDLDTYAARDQRAASAEPLDLATTQVLPRYEPAGANEASWKRPALAALCVGLLLIPVLLFWTGASGGDSADVNKKTQQVEPIKFEASLTEFEGPPQFLFDGLAMNPTQKFSGTWEVGQGPEGAYVLAGNGTRKFKCRDPKRNPLLAFQFECGFRHNESDLIRFAIQDEQGQASFTINISAEEAVLQYGSNGSASCPLQKFDEKTFGYHRISVSAQPDHWNIELDSKLVGQVPRPDNFEGPGSIDLTVEGKGLGHFESIRFRKLKN